MNNSDDIEWINDNDKLFYHISVKLLKNSQCEDNDIPPHAFSPQGNGLSVNWEKYCQTAEDCLAIKTDTYPDGRTNKTHGVGHFIASEVRAIEFLTVEHAPSKSNKAHSHIMGIPPTKPKEPHNQMRKKLKRIFKYWDISPILTTE